MVGCLRDGALELDWWIDRLGHITSPIALTRTVMWSDTQRTKEKKYITIVRPLLLLLVYCIYIYTAVVLGIEYDVPPALRTTRRGRGLGQRPLSSTPVVFVRRPAATRQDHHQ